MQALSTGYPRDTVRTRALVLDLSGVPLVRSKLSGWSLFVWRSSESSPIYDLEDQPASAVLTDTLNPWEFDTAGFNFEHAVNPDGLFEAEGGESLVFEYLLDCVDGGESFSRMLRHVRQVAPSRSK